MNILNKPTDGRFDGPTGASTRCLKKDHSAETHEVNESFAGGFLEQIFGFVDLRGQIWGSAFVRVIGDHDTSVRF